MTRQKAIYIRQRQIVGHTHTQRPSSSGLMAANAVGASISVNPDMAAKVSDRKTIENAQAAALQRSIEFGNACTLFGIGVAAHLDVANNRGDIRPPSRIDANELAEDEMSVADAEHSKGACMKIDALVEQNGSVSQVCVCRVFLGPGRLWAEPMNNLISCIASRQLIRLKCKPRDHLAHFAQ
jgi:hypothetical protein